MKKITDEICINLFINEIQTIEIYVSRWKFRIQGLGKYNLDNELAENADMFAVSWQMKDCYHHDWMFYTRVNMKKYPIEKNPSLQLYLFSSFDYTNITHCFIRCFRVPRADVKVVLRNRQTRRHQDQVPAVRNSICIMIRLKNNTRYPKVPASRLSPANELPFCAPRARNSSIASKWIRVSNGWRIYRVPDHRKHT